MNCPIDPETGEILGAKRIEEVIETLESLKDAKVVIASHQGRVGNNEYTGMDKHAKVLEKLMNRKIKYVEDIIGEAAQNAIKNLEEGEILLLDNLRLCAEENYEFTPENAAKTIMVSRLSKLFDLLCLRFISKCTQITSIYCRICTDVTSMCRKNRRERSKKFG